jgi:hypothetical protein
MPGLPHLSTDQVAAFIELSRVGQIRGAANALGITEQGVRNRLVALESQLGVELYRKSRGPRRASPLTPQGAVFCPMLWLSWNALTSCAGPAIWNPAGRKCALSPASI